MPNLPFLGREVSDIAMYRPFIYGSRGAASSNSPDATAAGLSILRQGGNAVDAAVAISLALGVVEPHHSGIGGGCFHVFYHKESGKFYAVDARGVAPIRAHEGMFLDESGEVDPELTEFTGRPVAVPALYRAMDQLLKRYGTMSWEQVSAPAIRLARDGFCCAFSYARVSNTPEAQHNRDSYAGFSALYLRDGQPREFGEWVQNPDLADTMEAVAREGVDWFYQGPIADEIVAHVNQDRGILTREDLIGCRVHERPPVRGTYRGYDIVSMPPPSSGGTHIVQMLNILEQFDLASMGHLSADSTHLLAETMKLMFADRSVAMGDPDFVNIQQERLLSKSYARELAAKIDMNRAQNFGPTEGIDAVEHRGCTSHFSVADKDGNVLVQTQTIRNWWGCGIVIPGRGFIMNNTMADFSPKVGVRTSQGLAYGSANAVRSQKTPLSSMAPTVVLKDGEPVLAVGAAGGPRIITSILQMIVNVIDFDMMMNSAVRAPHMACLTSEQGLELESGFSPDTARNLRERGHTLVEVDDFGVLLVMPNGIMCRDGLLFPAGTSRSDGGGGVLTRDGRIAMEGIQFT